MAVQYNYFLVNRNSIRCTHFEKKKPKRTREIFIYLMYTEDTHNNYGSLLHTITLIFMNKIDNVVVVIKYSYYTHYYYLRSLYILLFQQNFIFNLMVFHSSIGIFHRRIGGICSVVRIAMPSEQHNQGTLSGNCSRTQCSNL